MIFYNIPTSNDGGPMKNLEEFLRLSHYLKCYHLYQSFTEMDQRNRRAISRIESNLNGKEQWTEEEQNELVQYHQVLEQVDFNNKLLENSFNNYDFDSDAVEQAMTDYKLYAYEWIIDTIQESLSTKVYSEHKDIINHVCAAEKVLRKHFIEKFYIIDDLDQIFEKAIFNLLEKALGWDIDKIKEHFHIS